MQIKHFLALLLPLFLLLGSCGGSDDETEDNTLADTESEELVIDENEELEEEEAETQTTQAVDAALFALDSLASLEQVTCTLTNGETTICYEITVTGFPADRTNLGHFCPQNINANADASGKWFDNGILYDLTGDFITSLDEFYADDFWQLYDEQTGEVFITDTQVACEAAAQPQVEAAYFNHCVECDISYYSDEEGLGIASTYTIPINPVFRDAPGDISGANVGVALNGVNLAGAAPTAAILGAYTIAAFDDCVGHINPFAGYHYHGANHGDGDCPAIDFEEDGHAGIFAYAMDGFAIYSMLDENELEDSDLDECRGHSDESRGYHYHSAGPGENAFIGCFTGETVQDEGRP